MNSLVEVEICDMIVSNMFAKRKVRVRELCDIIMQRYPITYSIALHENVKRSLVDIFPIHRNKRLKVKTFRISRRKAIQYVQSNNIALVTTYEPSK